SSFHREQNPDMAVSCLARRTLLKSQLSAEFSLIPRCTHHLTTAHSVHPASWSCLFTECVNCQAESPSDSNSVLDEKVNSFQCARRWSSSTYIPTSSP